MSRTSALLLSLLAASLACDAREQPVRPPTSPGPPPVHRPTPTVAPVAATPQASGPQLAWGVRTAIAAGELQAADPSLYQKLLTLRPNRRVGDELFFGQQEIADPRAAAVLLKRLLNGDDPVAIRLAVVDALPGTGGDWQEGAAALVAVDASPRVRKKLVEILRYVAPPHNLDGLRLALRDENIAVRVAAVRTAGFTTGGANLFTELISATFDDDWDMRVAAVQALGQLTVRPDGVSNPARDRLVRMLGDEQPEVRWQVLVSLERIDPEGVRHLPELERLARDWRNRKVAEIAKRLLRDRPPEAGTERTAGGGGTLVTANP